VTDSATFTTPEASDEEELGDLLLEVLPGDGSTMGNLSAREALSRAAERQISEEEYEAVRDKALALGLVVKGRGRGGSIALAEGIEGGGRYEAPAAPTVNGRGRAKKDKKKTDDATNNYKEVLWDAAEELRNQMDAAEYKHLVLGLIFIKYISDTYAFHREMLRKVVSDPQSDFYAGEDPADQEAMLEDRDFFLGEGVF
jgi:type I restriction enzyme M protein